MPDDEISEARQIKINEFQEELRKLTTKMASSEDVGSKCTTEILEDELTFVQTIDVNAHTLDVYFPAWMEQFRANLLMTSGFLGNSWPPPKKDHCQSCIVVGAGPSLTEEQLSKLRGYKGAIICSNKALKRVLEYTVPDMVAVIHTTEDIADHFSGDRVLSNLEDIHVVASTYIHPAPAYILYSYAAPSRMHWFNPSIPDSFKRNTDEFMSRVSRCSVMDAGGNVGLFMCMLADMMGYENIGILGMEHTLTLDPKWTNQEVVDNYVVFYAPEDLPEAFALNRVFYGYLQNLLIWYLGTRGRKDVYNLTKAGFLYVGRRDGMPYMDLDEFVETFT